MKRRKYSLKLRQRIANAEGSGSEVMKKYNISSGYLSTLRKKYREVSAPVLAVDEMTEDLIKDLQNEIVRLRNEIADQKITIHALKELIKRNDLVR